MIAEFLARIAKASVLPLIVAVLAMMLVTFDAFDPQYKEKLIGVGIAAFLATAAVSELFTRWRNRRRAPAAPPAISAAPAPAEPAADRPPPPA